MRSGIIGLLGCIVLVVGCARAKAEGSATSDAGVAGLNATIPAAASSGAGEGVASKVCPLDMVEVEGDYCPDVSQKCLRWLDTDTSPTAHGGIGPMQCAEFEKPSKCLSSARIHKHFCMDKFEYPGEGTYPLVDIDYSQAKSMAKSNGKRLCTKDEFNFACEGEEMHPYGYGDGFHRDATVCNIDKPWRDYNQFPRSTWNDHDGGLNQSVKSDSNSKCKSVFGVFNLNGNVDEILDSEHSKNVILSGGYWSVVRNRCRPMTDSHDKSFSFYQVGFRGCFSISK